jgi:low temperature requirement protein LtrA
VTIHHSSTINLDAMSKVYNDLLLRTSISLVASEDGKQSGKSGSGASEEEKTQALSIAVSSALLLAFTVGMVQLVRYFGFASSFLGGMSVSSSPPMYYSAYCKF